MTIFIRNNSIALFVLFFFLHVSLCAQDSYIEVNQEHLDILIVSAIENDLTLDKHKIQIDAAKQERKMLNLEHLGLFSVSGNLNEFSVNDLTGNNNANNFFPRYNIGVNIRLNHFANNKAKKKILESEKKMLAKDSEERVRKLEEDVTKSYVEYLRKKKAFILRRRLDQFSEADFNAIERKFSEGEITLEEYSRSRTEFYNNKMKLLQDESAYLQAKTELETLVNAKLSKLGVE